MTLAGLLLTAVALVVSCTSQIKPAVTLETIGVRNEMAFVTLVSPSADEVSATDLANRLRQDWEWQLYRGYEIEVLVFDNREAPEKWLEVWDASVTEYKEAMAQIYPHWIATYSRNAVTGLNQVKILSRDANADVVRTITFPIRNGPD